MKLTKILESVIKELNVPKPEDAYKFDKIQKDDLGYGKMYTYVYTNVIGDKMEITNLVVKDKKIEPGKSILIAFKKYESNSIQEEEDYDDYWDFDDDEDYDQEDEEDKYSEKTGAKDFIKVLATVVAATKNTMKKEGGDKSIYAIKFSPADTKRKNIYLHYIETLFPDFKKDLRPTNDSWISFINKNFKSK